jgi:hypothetical protein
MLVRAHTHTHTHTHTCTHKHLAGAAAASAAAGGSDGGSDGPMLVRAGPRGSSPPLDAPSESGSIEDEVNLTHLCT